MNIKKILIIALALLTQACASLVPNEAEQLAWTGPGPGPCLFGGVTSRAVQHCVEVSLGEEAMLQSVNQAALAQLPRGARCTEHAAAVQTLLKQHPTVRAQLIYSCPNADSNCHVSVLATTVSGNEYVLDNGAVLGRAAGRVAPLTEFAALAGSYQIDQVPSMAQAIGLGDLFAGLSYPMDHSP